MDRVDLAALYAAARQSDDIFDSDSDSASQSELISDTVSLSASQHRAITYPANPGEILRIVAGPGSGKTFTITARIAHILANGTKPHEVLVLCMANRSVDAVRAALTTAIGEEYAKSVTVSTFHSFCALVIDLHRTRRRVFDKQTWRNMARTFLAKLMLLENHRVQGTVSPAVMGLVLEKIASGALTVEEAAAQHRISADYLGAVVRYIRRQGVACFDDLVHECVQLLAENQPKTEGASAGPENTAQDSDPAATDTLDLSGSDIPHNPVDLLDACKAVFVDECQDIHPLLLKVIKAVVTFPTTGLTALHKHLTVAGDPRQCIYEFLGARRETMAELPRELFPTNVVDVPLQELFRCTQPVLDAAMDLCPGAIPPDLVPLGRLVSSRDGVAAQPVLMHATSTRAELMAIGTEIARLICCLGGLLQLLDVAVLTRTNAEAEEVEQVLTNTFGIACARAVPGNAWVDSPMHIYRDVVSVIVGEAGAEFSLLTLLSVLDTDYGSRVRAAKVFQCSSEPPYANSTNALEAFLFDELEKIEQGQAKESALHRIYRNYPQLLERIAEFLNQVQLERLRVRELHAQNPLAYTPLELVQCLTRMAALAGIHKYVFDSHTKEKGSKEKSNAMLASFNLSLHHSYSLYAREAQPGHTFMEHFLLTYNNEVPPSTANAVRASTIHSAKGLEFPVVFVLGLHDFRAPWEKLLMPPSDKATHVPTHHLLFVAFTRAKQLLYIGSRLMYETLPALTRARLLPQRPQFLLTSEPSVLSTDLPVRADPADTEGLAAAFGQLKIASDPQPTRLLRSLAENLKRDMPLPEKVVRGERLFAQLFPAELKKEPFFRPVFPRMPNNPLQSTLRPAKAILRRG